MGLYGVMLNLIELVLIKAVTEHFGYLFQLLDLDVMGLELMVSECMDLPGFIT